MLKSFKDVNGNKVVLGGLVSIVDDEITSIFKVKSIRRTGRFIEATINNQSHGTMFVYSIDLISEEA